MFATDPLLPLPDPSATIDPDPSSNAKAATKPGVAAGVEEMEVSAYAVAATANSATIGRRADRRGNQAKAFTSDPSPRLPPPEQRLTARALIVNLDEPILTMPDGDREGLAGAALRHVFHAYGSDMRHNFSRHRERLVSSALDTGAVNPTRGWYLDRLFGCFPGPRYV